MFPLEVPVFSPHSASRAIAQHAARVELNRGGSYPAGGLTPTVADLEALVVSGKVNPPIRVMIRPRGAPSLPLGQDQGQGQGQADFLYSEAEFAEMRAAIEEFKASGHMKLERGDGFVFGCLKVQKKAEEEEKGMINGERGLVVDVVKNRELVALAKPFPAVFHRAFDDVLGSQSTSVEDALSDLKACGFHGLLTSGGPGSAVHNREVVARIISAAPGRLREVIVGGGVRSTNVEELKRPSFSVPEGVDVWFHSSCLTRTGDGDGDGDVVDEEEVRAIVTALA